MSFRRQTQALGTNPQDKNQYQSGLSDTCLYFATRFRLDSARVQAHFNVVSYENEVLSCGMVTVDGHGMGMVAGRRHGPPPVPPL